MVSGAMTKQMTEQRPPSLRGIPAIVLLVSIAALAVAFASQHLGGLQPCQLCIWQRWGYAGAIALALIAYLVPLRLRPWGAVLASLALLATAGIALFHAGVEYHWWAGLASCTGNLDTSQSLSALEQQLLATPVIPCDRAAWSMFGISMAGYDFLYAGALGLLCLAASLRLIRR
jgi:disulfide bond formation protein DsbB